MACTSLWRLCDLHNDQKIAKQQSDLTRRLATRLRTALRFGQPMEQGIELGIGEGSGLVACRVIEQSGQSVGELGLIQQTVRVRVQPPKRLSQSARYVSRMQ